MHSQVIATIFSAALLLVSPLPAAAAEPVLQYGEGGVGTGDFLGARGIDIDGAGNVFIADRIRNRILRYNIDGKFVAQSPFFFAGPPSVSFDQVTDVAITPDQRLYTANEDDAQVVVLDFDFNVILTFGSQCVSPSIPGPGCLDPDDGGPLEVGDGQFNEVTGVAYHPSDRIIAVDIGNHRIQVFDLDGNFIFKFGSEGSGDGEFQSPSAVEADKDGNIYVADTGNDRIQIFDSDGNFVRAFGASGAGDGLFATPTGLVVDYAGNVYVADSSPNNPVQIFDASGDFVSNFSLPDDTANVRDVAIDGMARIHVTTGNASGLPLDVPFVVGVFEIDTDGDSLPDLWEQAGIDVHLDGEIDLDLTNVGNDYRGIPMVADPNRKDIFVEVDYFRCSDPGGDCGGGDSHSHRPRDDALDLIVQSFNDAPVTEGEGINLWVQVDESVPHQQNCDLDDICFDTIKAARFGTPAERNDPGSDVLEAKALAFRYNLWVHDKEPGNSSSGEAEGSAGEVGNDFIVSLGSWTGNVGSREEQAGLFMHELGHTLGLGHGGGDDTNCKPNYLSIMSYTFTTVGLQPTGQFDYSRDILPTSGSLVEDNLNETIGIQDGAFITFHGPLRDVDGDGSDDDWVPAEGSGAINWDFNNSIGDNPALPTDINFLGITGCGTGTPDDSPEDTLTGFDDWEIIQIGFKDSPFFEDGEHGTPEVEIDFETARIVRDRVWHAQLTKIHEYSAKFICGIQKNPDVFRLAPGRYSTIVNIHNPNRKPVTFKKKLALAFPPKEQEPGKIYEISLDTLRDDEVLKVDCEDVRENVFGGNFPEPYIDGFLVVQSPRSLDVAAVYSTATVGDDETPPHHSDIEVVRVPERITDLRPAKQADLVVDRRLASNFSCNGSDTTQQCNIAVNFRVRNIGDATAGQFNVQIVHKLNAAVLEDIPVNEELAPGDVANRVFNAEIIIVGQQPDARTICIEADAPVSQVEEKKEGNNERCLDF